MPGVFGSHHQRERAKILVVDDEPNLVAILQDRIRRAEYEVIAAGNGQEGLEKAVSEKPDLILLDIKMPVMDGIEMLKRLRNHKTLKSTAVIMLTKVFQPEYIATAACYGVAEYVVKPFNLGELMDKIEETLESRISR